MTATIDQEFTESLLRTFNDPSDLPVHLLFHGVGTRELDAFGDEVLAAVRPMLELRYRLLPYILGEAHRSASAGLPMARALVVEFPDDPTTWHIDDQWLLAEHLLVAPILDPTGHRRVHLPAGRWVDWWTGDATIGPRWIDIEASVEQIPLWIRDDGAITLGPPMGYVGERSTDAVTVRAVAPMPGRDTHGRADIDGDLVDWHWSEAELQVETTHADVTVEHLLPHGEAR